MSIIIIGSIIGLFLLPGQLAHFYPIANFIGLVVLLQIVISIVYLRKIKVVVDIYFIIGISFLIMGFIVFILNNLNIISNSFFTDNGAKFGIGLEIIFLSLSMSNRIRNLRMENELNQQLVLQRSEDMNEIKSSLISNLSHELRTPLNLIMGMANSITETEKGDVNEKCKLILNSSENLLGQIDDILDFTVIEKGDHSLKEKSFNLNRTLSKVVEANNNKASIKNLDFIFTQDPGLPETIIGDRAKLVQILDNLLDNAIKFTLEGHIKLHVAHSKKEKDSIVIHFSILDSGIGISEEKMSTVFESFTKKSFKDKREFYGLGLGLYIVKSYVDLHGGSVQLQNASNGGTICEVNLPFKTVEDHLLPRPGTVTPSEKIDGMYKILLVEDNKMNQHVISHMLKKWQNISLSIANNGQEAIERISEETFDLVLMDLQMPIMDGFETTAIIRGGKLNNIDAEVPILVITADCTYETMKEIFRLGANDYMTKPLNAQTLFNKITPHLQLLETPLSR
jgi:signal transduction histidine kinase/CheY-like chemotaxis protein